jgi:hypothetical protein
VSYTDPDGIDYFRSVLRQLGLDTPSLIEWANEKILAGESIDRIIFDLERRPEYDRAFPEIAERRRRQEATGVQMSPIDPGTILDYRVQAKALMRSYGLPPSYYDNASVLFNLVVNDKSLAELNDSLDLLQKRVANAPAEIGLVFAENFGANAREAMFLAFTNDEQTLPALEDMVQQAEAGGAARRLGFNLSAAEMGRVADINLGYDQLVSGFGTLDERRGLFDETISERDDYTVGVEGIDAAFNIGGGAVRKLAQRGEARAAETGGQAGTLNEQRGVSGLGTAGKR